MSTDDKNLEFVRQIARDLIASAPSDWQEVLKTKISPQDDLFGGLTPFEWENIEVYVERIAPIVMQRMSEAFDNDKIAARCEHCGLWFLDAEDRLDARFERHHRDQHHAECLTRTMPVGKSGLRIPITVPDTEKAKWN